LDTGTVRSPSASWAEQGPRLVDEGGVGHGPGHCVERGAAAPVQPLDVGWVEDPLGCRGEQRPGPEQVVQELVR
jgi:hypothetical protein